MTDAAELARPVRLDGLGDEPRAVSIVANEAERAALARRFGLLAIERLEAEATLCREGERFLCAGRLRAAVTQACVASGEPVPATVDEEFRLAFVPTRDGQADEEVELAADDLDLIEFEGGAVDVGEAVAQTLALALNPFPRAPAAEEALRDAGVLGAEDAGPFAALKALKDRL